jgi:RNA polymerase sigma factor (sigma-70 family)
MQGFLYDNRIIIERKKEMEPSSFDINDNITLKLKTYSDMVYRICYMYLHNSSDVEDAFQEVLLKLLQTKKNFENTEYEKAWLIRVTINQCKDMLKSFWKKRVDFIEDMELPYEDTGENELLQIILSLPPKYKDSVYLYYYEEYTVPQMAKILNKNENTIYSYLHRAKALIKHELGEEKYELGEEEHEYTYSIRAESH